MKHLKYTVLGLLMMFILLFVVALIMAVLGGVFLAVHHAPWPLLKGTLITLAVLAIAWLIGWDANRKDSK